MKVVARGEFAPNGDAVEACSDGRGPGCPIAIWHYVDPTLVTQDDPRNPQRQLPNLMRMVDTAVQTVRTLVRSFSEPRMPEGFKMCIRPE